MSKEITPIHEVHIQDEHFYIAEELAKLVHIKDEEIIQLNKHAYRWQAAFSLTAILAIWLIAMRFV